MSRKVQKVNFRMAEEEIDVNYPIRRILLCSREDNCVKEVIDFLLNSKCESLKNIEEKSNGVEAFTKYTYGNGSPTVNKENWLGNSRVHFILKLLDPNDISWYHHIYDAVIVSLSDEDEFDLIIHLIRNKFHQTKFSRWTVIGKWCNRLLEEPLPNLTSTRWSWNDRIAYNWSTDLPVTNNLWLHICGFSGENWPTRVSYKSIRIEKVKTAILSFFNLLLQVINSNIRSLSNGTKKDFLQTLFRGVIWATSSQNLLMQCNVLSVSEFNSLLKEEVKQLACHLSRLIILCDEDLGFGPKIFRQFEKIKNCKDLYMKDLKSINKENITEAVLHSLNIMSGMKYTGHFIKSELGIDKINALKEHLLLRNVEGNFWYVTKTIVESPLGDGGKEDIQGDNRIRETHSDNRIQDIHIDNRIGNIQLLKSLQGSLQEFTDELKNVRHIQENYMKNTSENFREIKEEIRHLKQKLDEVSLKINE